MRVVCVSRGGLAPGAMHPFVARAHAPAMTQCAAGVWMGLAGMDVLRRPTFLRFLLAGCACMRAQHPGGTARHLASAQPPHSLRIASIIQRSALAPAACRWAPTCGAGCLAGCGTPGPAEHSDSRIHKGDDEPRHSMVHHNGGHRAAVQRPVQPRLAHIAAPARTT